MANDTHTAPTLGRRFLEAGGKWAVGMWVTHMGVTGTVVWIDGLGDPTVWWTDLHETRHHGHSSSWEIVPDLGAGQTLGCVMAQVRMRWNDPTLYAHQGSDGTWWHVLTAHQFSPAGSGPTEAEALVAALEARAPTVPAGGR